MKVQGLLMVAGLAATFAAPASAAEPVSRDEVRSIVAEMMADAESRSTLQGGGTAGYDKGFFLASSDNKFRLNISGYTQFRYTANFQDQNNTAGGADTFSNGFNVRRAVLDFSGNAGSEDLTYRVRILQNGDGASGNGDFNIEDAWAAYGLGGGWKVRAGQFRTMFWKENNNADINTMATDRSIVDSAFGQDFSQGVGVIFNSDQIDFNLDFTDGIGSARNRLFSADRSSTTTFNTTNGAGAFTSVTTSEAADWAVSGRAEYTFAGDKNQLKDYTSAQDEKFAGNVGIGGFFQQSANNGTANVTPPTNTQIVNNLTGFTIDAQVEGNGFGAFVGGVGTIRDFRSAGNDVGTLNDYGFLAQVNFRVLPKTDIFARYELLGIDNDHGAPLGGSVTATESQKYYQFITAGVTQYIVGTHTKLTVDAVFALNRTASDANTQRLDGTGNVIGNPGLNQGPSGNTIGLFGSNRGIEVALRAQLQVAF